MNDEQYIEPTNVQAVEHDMTMISKKIDGQIQDLEHRITKLVQQTGGQWSVDWQAKQKLIHTAQAQMNTQFSHGTRILGAMREAIQRTDLNNANQF
ncbi:hypothetical protein ACFWY9_00735 [Amycolatopsis sp. NPDC059027]|uniref:hypothetical protein n=1 Tax=unclassified Amycolatopsis TaxID=2618356 RepID=UPI00366F4EC7